MPYGEYGIVETFRVEKPTTNGNNTCDNEWTKFSENVINFFDKKMMIASALG
jgi:hypothetical protein